MELFKALEKMFDFKQVREELNLEKDSSGKILIQCTSTAKPTLTSRKIASDIHAGLTAMMEGRGFNTLRLRTSIFGYQLLVMVDTGDAHLFDFVIELTEHSQPRVANCNVVNELGKAVPHEVSTILDVFKIFLGNYDKVQTSGELKGQDLAKEFNSGKFRDSSELTSEILAELESIEESFKWVEYLEQALTQIGEDYIQPIDVRGSSSRYTSLNELQERTLNYLTYGSSKYALELVSMWGVLAGVEVGRTRELVAYGNSIRYLMDNIQVPLGQPLTTQVRRIDVVPVRIF